VPVPRGDPIYVNVTVEDKGTFAETFTLYVFADRDITNIGGDLIIANTMISLSPGEAVTVTITRDTTEAPYGSYYISAKANPVL